MRTIAASAILAVIFIAAPFSQTSPTSGRSGSLDRAFSPAGRINLDLSAGDYQITSSSDNRVRMRWTVGNPEDLAEVQATAEVKGTEATLTTDGPNNFDVEIQVPSRSDLYVRLTAGDMTISGIEGNKDVSVLAGDLTIDVGRPEDYRLVEGSVWAGEVHATPFNISKEGLFRSFTWNGKGRYTLAARLKAGEVHLR